MWSSGVRLPISPTTSTSGLGELPGSGPWGGSCMWSGRRVPGRAWAWSQPCGRGRGERRRCHCSLWCRCTRPLPDARPHAVGSDRPDGSAAHLQDWAHVGGIRRRQGGGRAPGGLFETGVGTRWSPRTSLQAPGTSVPACAGYGKVLYPAAALLAFSLSPLAALFAHQERGFLPPEGGVLDGAQPLARTCGAGEEPQAGTCAVRVQFPSRLSGTDRIVLKVNVLGIAYLPSTPHHLWG